MKHSALLYLLVAGCQFLSAQDQTGSINHVTGGCDPTLQSCWSAISNPAGLVHSPRRSFAITSSIHGGTPEWKSGALAWQFPVKKLSCGLVYSYDGIPVFQRQKATLSIARPLHTRLSLAIQANSHWLTQADYPSAHCLTVAMGLQIKLNPYNHFAFFLFNPTYSQFGKNNTGPPVPFGRLSASHRLSTAVCVNAGWEQYLAQPSSLNISVYYQPLPAVCFALGCKTGPLRLSFGTGMHFKRIQIQFAFVVNPVIGWMPSADLLHERP